MGDLIGRKPTQQEIDAAAEAIENYKDELAGRHVMVKDGFYAGFFAGIAYQQREQHRKETASASAAGIADAVKTLDDGRVVVPGGTTEAP